MYYKCTALDLLETREWQGEYIPYCFVEGNKNIVDGKVYYTGIYEDMISTQVLYNYATNTAIELAESAPIAPFVGDSRAFKGFEKFYDEANTKNYSYLPYNGVDAMGNPIDPATGQPMTGTPALGGPPAPAPAEAGQATQQPVQEEEQPPSKFQVRPNELEFVQ
jgi:hypothetical protein